VVGRADLSERIATLVGDDVLRITNAGSGWPALGELVVEGVAIPIALFAGAVGLSHRNRDDIERRFQNPAQDRPIIEVPGREPLLLGLWESDQLVDVERPLLVSADPYHRLGRTTRFSVFASMAALQAALLTGWEEGKSATGETIRCFVPPMLPLSFAADRANATPPSVAMQAAIEASGLLAAADEEVPAATQRARRAGTSLVRDARFSRRVIDAYEGLCAMCGLDVGLVEGAHIYPVSAPGSHDEVWNGLALCANHHLAFDKHLVGVDFETNEIGLHATIHEQVESSPAVAAFVAGTFPALVRPHDRSASPRPQMFQKRYEHFVDQYDWLFEP
jgi:hypothetical protein